MEGAADGGGGSAVSVADDDGGDGGGDERRHCCGSHGNAVSCQTVLCLMEQCYSHSRSHSARVYPHPLQLLLPS